MAREFKDLKVTDELRAAFAKYGITGDAKILEICEKVWSLIPDTFKFTFYSNEDMVTTIKAYLGSYLGATKNTASLGRSIDDPEDTDDHDGPEGP